MIKSIKIAAGYKITTLIFDSEEEEKEAIADLESRGFKLALNDEKAEPNTFHKWLLGIVVTESV